MNIKIKSKNSELFFCHLLFYLFRLLIDLCQSRRGVCKEIIASLWRENSSHDLGTELCTRV